MLDAFLPFIAAPVTKTERGPLTVFLLSGWLGSRWRSYARYDFALFPVGRLARRSPSKVEGAKVAQLGAGNAELRTLNSERGSQNAEPRFPALGV